MIESKSQTCLNMFDTNKHDSYNICFFYKNKEIQIKINKKFAIYTNKSTIRIPQTHTKYSDNLNANPEPRLFCARQTNDIPRLSLGCICKICVRSSGVETKAFLVPFGSHGAEHRRLCTRHNLLSAGSEPRQGCSRSAGCGSA